MADKPTLLLVDDEERILRSLKLAFMGKYEVESTTSGHEALKILQQKTIHVIVSDQRMPEMTGVDLLRQARTISPDTMRILLTGYADLTAIVGSVNEGEIYRYINKPWKAAELKEIVGEAADIAMRMFDKSSPSTGEETQNMPQKGMGFLVVDNDESTFESVKNIVGKDNTVYWGNNLDEVFELLSQKDVSIVISEINIGGQNTSDTIKILKQYNPNMLTIVLTSFQDTKMLIDLINQGQIYRFLPKPIHTGLLEKSLHAAMQHYQLMKARPHLLMRHKVEKSENEGGSKFSSKIKGYLQKIRGRSSAARVSA